MNKNEAKKNIQKLIDKYQAVVKSGRINKYSEEETKKDFILPFFEILGWDVHDKNEVSAEESQASGKRVDYGFYIDNRPKFFLEAKAFKQDIHKEEFAKQAVRYSWNKGVTWAVLTNFETIIVFNAQDIESRYLGDKRLFEIPCNEYIERFDQLWQLSRESLETNSIDKYAEQIGKKLQKISISATLYKDLSICREMLTKSISISNPTVDKDLIDEGVQRLLDRLIFIRVAEDREIEPPTLVPLLREWETKHRGKIPVYQSMIKKFRELDKIYNSNLFLPHPFENWDDNGGVVEKVIPLLYGKEGYYEYDFKVMPADILGSVYENYLGYRLAKSKKGTTISKDAKKRKEQGIYYTPTFIVDYIVKNSLKPVLDQCKSISDLKKIKVLDPACGSGSFLVKALEVISEKYKEFHYQREAYTKFEILTENIYGVDLDEQAVEIARLNLLVNALDKRVKLPILTNIKNGNSLISGTDEELKKYFGSNFKDKKPFNWEEEFPEVFAQGGFDVVIGNPPYVRNRELENKDKEFFAKKYSTAAGQYDLYQLFFERSLKLLKTGGLISFITSNKYTIAGYGEKLREYLLQNSRIISMVDVSNLDVFKDAATYPYIIVFKKDKENRDNLISAYKPTDETSLTKNEIKISQSQLSKTESKAFVLKEENPLLKKIESVSEKLGDICIIKETIHTGNVRQKLIISEKLDKNCKKLLAGKDCHRYHFEWNGKWIRYDKSLIDKKKGEYGNICEPKYFENPKILLRDISLYPEAVFDDEKYYSVNTLYSIQTTDKNYNLLYLLSVINSNLVRFYFNERFEDAHVAGGFLRFKKIYSSQIPIRKINFSNPKEKEKHDNLVKLADKMLKLNKELQKIPENSNKWQKLKDEIEKTDKKIDEEIYKLYDLTEKEIKIIEDEE